VPAPEGPGPRARPAAGAAGAGVTAGNSPARLPPGAAADRPGTVPRGKADGLASGPVTLRTPAEPLPLCPGGAGSRCDGEGEGDWDLLGEGDGLGQGALFGDEEAGPGDGDGLGHGDLLGEGDGLGEGGLLGDGEGDLDGEGDGVLGEGLGAGDDLLGDGDGAALDPVGEGEGDAVAAAPVPGRTASMIPTAIAPPPAMASTPAHGRADMTLL
jgi:hypothetical protein